MIENSFTKQFFIKEIWKTIEVPGFYIFDTCLRVGNINTSTGKSSIYRRPPIKKYLMKDIHALTDKEYD